MGLRVWVTKIEFRVWSAVKDYVVNVLHLFWKAQIVNRVT
jgi:hypothetical protein